MATILKVTKDHQADYCRRLLGSQLDSEFVNSERFLNIIVMIFNLFTRCLLSIHPLITFKIMFKRIGVVNSPSKNARLAKIKPNSRGLVVSYFYGGPSGSLDFFFQC